MSQGLPVCGLLTKPIRQEEHYNRRRADLGGLLNSWWWLLLVLVDGMHVFQNIECMHVADKTGRVEHCTSSTSCALVKIACCTSSLCTDT